MEVDFGLGDGFVWNGFAEMPFRERVGICKDRDGHELGLGM